MKAAILIFKITCPHCINNFNNVFNYSVQTITDKINLPLENKQIKCSKCDKEFSIEFKIEITIEK